MPAYWVDGGLSNSRASNIGQVIARSGFLLAAVQLVSGYFQDWLFSARVVGLICMSSGRGLLSSLLRKRLTAENFAISFSP